MMKCLIQLLQKFIYKYNLKKYIDLAVKKFPLAKKMLFQYKMSKLWGIIHVHGTAPHIVYEDFGSFQSRNESTITLLKNVFEVYEKEFSGRAFDFYIYTMDKAEEAEIYRNKLKIPYIFSYATKRGMENKVIPIPDFVFDAWKECGIPSWEYMIKMCTEKGKYKYEDSRCFWIGNVKTHNTRQTLVELSNENKDLILAEGMQWLNLEKGKAQKSTKFVSLFDHGKYKYLIDIQGYGYSARLKVLLHLNRLVIVADRKDREFYFDKLVDGENCIIVKEDLSDMVDRLKDVENDTDKYKKIVDGERKFAEKYLSKEYAIEYLGEKLDKYGSNK